MAKTVEASRSLVKEGDIVYGAVPGQSTFYTTAESLDATDGTRAGVADALQVKEHPTLGFRPGTTAYQVIANTPAATAITSANPQYGSGGAQQLYIPDYKNSLQPLYAVPLKK